jgi:hypothetical protein
MSEPVLQVKGFKGTVITHNWIRGLDGVEYDQFYGTISVLSDTEVVGFEAKGHDTANWIARIEGETSSYNIMGCQVKCIIQSDEKPQTVRGLIIP